MIQQEHEDGSFTELYEDGDLVELIEDQGLGWSEAKKGEWGRVILTGDDAARGHTTCISFLMIATAGVSTPRDSFLQRHVGVPCWKVRLKQEGLDQ